MRSLSDVAAQASISRPTLYKVFASKDELLTAFGQFVLPFLRDDLTRAFKAHRGRRRLDATLQFLADFYSSYQMRGLVEIEPDVVASTAAAVR